jgi:integrase
MARTLNRLNARFVQTVSEPGRYADGGNLYLDTTNGGRRWIFLFRWKVPSEDGGSADRFKRVEMGLGPLRNVSLVKARALAAQAREWIAEGINPIEARKAERDAAALAAEAQEAAPAPKRVTFGECADELLRNIDGSFRNAKHAAQWRMTLDVYAAPLRAIPVADVSTDNVLEVLKPLWSTKAETASRLRGRIERVLNFAKAKGHRTGENPALWRGHLDQILSKRQRLTRGHHAALAFSDVPAFMVDLRARPAIAARALEFAILTGARSGEVLGARWSEIDLDSASWTIPAARMKAGKAHRVPLSPAALAVLRQMEGSRKMADGKLRDFVFPSQGRDESRDAPLSTMGMAMLLRRMELSVTVHGFRSSFRDWAAEATNTPNEICEMALAHVVENRAEAAYRRGDLFEKRRVLMDDWAAYCGGSLPQDSTPA